MQAFISGGLMYCGCVAISVIRSVLEKSLYMPEFSRKCQYASSLIRPVPSVV